MLSLYNKQPDGRLLTLAASVLAVWLISMGNADAHGGAKGIVKQRMNAMSEMKDAMKALKAALPDVAESATARRHGVLAAKLIRDRAGKHLTRLFPAGSLEKSSEATPVVWEEWPRFETSALEMQSVADALAARLARNANPGRIPANLRGLSATALFERTAGTCKSCHNDFRQR